MNLVCGLGAAMRPHVLNVQIANNCFVKTAGLVPLELEVYGLSGLVPFSVLDGFSTGEYDAVLGCNVLELPGSGGRPREPVS